MINIREYVVDLNVGNGDTKRINCPNCNGYKTFTVTNNMGRLLWNCYKVTCSVSGNSKVRLTVDDIKGTLKKLKDNETFVLPEYVVPHGYRKEVMQFCELWDLDPDAVNLHYDVKENRVVFPVQDRGTILDAVGRSVTKRLPKWKRYGNSDLPFTFGYGRVAVVVEDCVSASVFSTAIIALDPDALPKTLSFAKELRGYVNDIRVIKLQDDLKYRDNNDLINLMNLTPKEI